MSNSYKSVILIIRDVVFGEDNYNYSDLLCDDISYLYRVFNAHSLTHLLTYKLMQFNEINFSTGLYKKIRQSYLKEIRRLARQDLVISSIEEKLETNKIEYLFLKGVNIRKLYPERWMRSSNDIDILVKEEDFDDAKSTMSKDTKLDVISDDSHHSELITQKNTIVELHKCAFSNPTEEKIEITHMIWETSKKNDDRQYKRSINFSAEYLHHIIHMKGHFLSGGCGIRYFIDLFLLRKQIEYEKEKDTIESLLTKYNVVKFERECSKLASAWFGDQNTNYSKDLETFVLNGGTFGTLKQKVMINQSGRNDYLMRRIFPRYDRLALEYPLIKRHKILVPICYIKRIFKLLFSGFLENFKAEAKVVESISQDEVDKYLRLKENLGI